MQGAEYGGNHVVEDVEVDDYYGTAEGDAVTKLRDEGAIGDEDYGQDLELIGQAVIAKVK